MCHVNNLKKAKEIRAKGHKLIRGYKFIDPCRFYGWDVMFLQVGLNKAIDILNDEPAKKTLYKDGEKVSSGFYILLNKPSGRPAHNQSTWYAHRLIRCYFYADEVTSWGTSLGMAFRAPCVTVPRMWIKRENGVKIRD